MKRQTRTDKLVYVNLLKSIGLVCFYSPHISEHRHSPSEPKDTGENY